MALGLSTVARRLKHMDFDFETGLFYGMVVPVVTLIAGAALFAAGSLGVYYYDTYNAPPENLEVRLLSSEIQPVQISFIRMNDYVSIPIYGVQTILNVAYGSQQASCPLESDRIEEFKPNQLVSIRAKKGSYTGKLHCLGVN